MEEPLLGETEISPGLVAIVILTHSLIEVFWLYYCTSRLSGPLRFFSVVPTVALNALTPLLYSPKVLVQPNPMMDRVGLITSSFLSLWLLNSKVIAYGLNRGALATMHSEGFWKFMGTALLPIHPKMGRRDKEDLSAPQSKVVPLSFKIREFARWNLQIVIKVGFLVTELYILHKRFLSDLNSIFYCGGLMFILGIGLDFAQVLALLLFNIETYDSFNHPYLSCDLSDLWSKRWNLVTGAAFKYLSYDIIMDGRFFAPDVKSEFTRPIRSPFIRALALLAIFCLNSSVHVLFVWYIGGFWSWKCMAFFSLFGPLLVIEKSIKDYFGGWLNRTENKFTFSAVSRRLSGIIYSMGIAFFAAHYLFVPPIDRLGIQSEATRFWKSLGY